MENWNCDGSGPHTGPTVKVYPLGGRGNLLICRNCWEAENRYRRLRGYETKRPEDWPELDWNKAETYTN